MASVSHFVLYEMSRKRIRTITSFFGRTSDTEDTEDVNNQRPREERETKCDESQTRNFQPRWLQDHSWLRYTDGKMFCYFCQQANKSNPFGEKGCMNFRTSTLNRHLDSADHKNAVQEDAMRVTLASSREKMINEENASIIQAMKSVYWLAKEDIATHKYDSLLTFMEEVGVESIKQLSIGANATYRTHHSAEDIQDSISTVIINNVDTLIEKSPFVSILADDSTDKSTKENCIVYVKLLDNWKPQVHFLENVKIYDGKADTIVTVIRKVISDRKIKADQLVGMGSDGASVMTGNKTGVATQLKRDHPFLISIHCMAHRLALCTSQAASGIPYLDRFKENLTAMYKYFDKSALRSTNLGEFQKIFDDPQIKLKEVYDIRWFSFYNALESLYRTWSSLLAFMGSQKDPKSGFEKTLKEFKFVATISLLMDVIPILTFLSLVFQREHVDLSSIQAAIKSTVSQVAALKTKDGKFLSEVLPPKDSASHVMFKDVQIHIKKGEIQQFTSMKLKFLDNILENLNKRFPDDSNQIMSCLSILSLRGIRFHENFSSFGAKEIDCLLNHYGKDKGNSKALVCSDQCLLEWQYLKELVINQQYPTGEMESLWRLIESHHAEEVPNLIRLAAIALVLPTNTAACERGFSAQNRIKDSSRCRLTPNRLNCLMTISIEGPDLKEFNFSAAFQEWAKKKRRALTVHH